MPIIPAQAPKRKYKVPMSLWFVEKNQRERVTGSMAESEVVSCRLIEGAEHGPLLPSPEVKTRQNASLETYPIGAGASPVFIEREKSRLKPAGLGV